MSHIRSYIIFAAFLLSFTTTVTLECVHQGWRTQHSDCWGECVRVTRARRRDPFTLNPAQIQSSCGAYRDEQQDTTHAGAMPGCDYIWKANEKNLRAYCTNVVRPVHFIPIPARHTIERLTRTRAACVNPECNSVRQVNTHEYCRQDNDDDEQSVDSCPICPPGTVEHAVMACTYMDQTKRTATRICQVKGDADWVSYDATGRRSHWRVHWKAAVFAPGEPPKNYQYTQFESDGTGERHITSARLSLDNLYLQYYHDLGMREESRLLGGYGGYGYYQRHKPHVHQKKHW